ncbi:hypothetical protein PQU92_13825 [Asticcacaulis sp. BYS171W]|uniref:Uncharacterized protein n=1 Tax=Asticcacaulis aquaticus TaxID=2984212 RepID=A0ABT5HW92_9CAUL|nr:hypothetical protein [Asticcacaulis aquaticus]MDC7684362.1 hypothetical protein [Asticcacaulis aquaticus]
MLASAGYFVSKRALYVATGWLCLFLAQVILASCTPEPTASYAVRVAVRPAQAATVTSR